MSRRLDDKWMIAVCLTVALGVSGTARAQIADGSFEGIASGSASLPTGWIASVAGFTRIMPYQTCISETPSMPSQGAKWLRISSGTLFAPTTSPAAYAATNNVRTTFTTGPTTTQISLDVAFVTGEGPGDPTYDDFCAATITLGAVTQQIGILDTTNGTFPLVSCASINSRPMTARTTFAADLSQFPGWSPTASFTLRVFCANGVDGVNPSYAYVDNVQLVVPPPPPFAISLVNAAGNFTFRSIDGAHPGAEVFNLFTLTLAAPLGSGPVFGIAFDDALIQQVISPVGTIPFHVLLDGAGQFSFGPFGLPPGLTIDAVGLRLNAGQVAEWTPAARFNT